MLDSYSSAGAVEHSVVLPTTGPVWVLLPTYNEAENIEAMVTAVLANLPAPRRVLIVDDNSPDGTGKIADRLAAEHAEVSVLHRPRKEGLGPACIAGFDEARARGAKLVIELDSDFSHHPRHLPELLAAAEEADVVLGSRYVPGGRTEGCGLWRRFISKFGNTYARYALGVSIRDLTGGFKCFRPEVLDKIEVDSITSEGYVFMVETTYRAIGAGFRVVEVPIVFRDRTAGTSKMTKRIVAEAAWRVPAMRLSGPRRRRRPRWLRSYAREALSPPQVTPDEEHAVDSVRD